MGVNKSHIGIGAVCLLAGIVLGFFLKGCKPSSPAEPIVIHDTISVTDTLHIAGHTKTLYVTKWDTIEVRDTDTIKIEIPIEHREYRDTFVTDSSRIELGVYFEGYKAKIDSIDLNYRFEVQPQVQVKKKGWGQFVGIGVGGGYGASIVGQTVYAAPQIGVSIVYGFGYHW